MDVFSVCNDSIQYDIIDMSDLTQLNLVYV